MRTRRRLQRRHLCTPSGKRPDLIEAQQTNVFAASRLISRINGGVESKNPIAGLPALVPRFVCGCRERNVLRMRDYNPRKFVLGKTIIPLIQGIFGGRTRTSAVVARQRASQASSPSMGSQQTIIYRSSIKIKKEGVRGGPGGFGWAGNPVVTLAWPAWLSSGSAAGRDMRARSTCHLQWSDSVRNEMHRCNKTTPFSQNLRSTVSFRRDALPYSLPSLPICR